MDEKSLNRIAYDVLESQKYLPKETDIGPHEMTEEEYYTYFGKTSEESSKILKNTIYGIFAKNFLSELKDYQLEILKRMADGYKIY